MLRIGSSSSSVGVVRRVARRVALGVGAGTGIAGAAITGYAYTEQGLGFRREAQFWSVVAPVVFDYWWNASSSSPYVKYYPKLKSIWGTTTTTATTTTTDQEDKVQVKHNENDKSNPDENEDEKQAETKRRRQQLLQQLHERNAPRIFEIILSLGGLYIKLGQVLSVTAIPIPEEYRELFRTLQSNVPGHEEFESVVKPTLEREFKRPLEEIFESIDQIPCGAASIGQAHHAVLRETGEEVVVKVQYPNAKWQVPADIQCVGDFLTLCVWYGLVDDSMSRLSYEEFSRQFLAELDYNQERENLQQVYESSLDPASPYGRRGVVIPRVFPELCTKQIVTMTFLPGPKFEEEAKEQLAMLGVFDKKKNLRSIVQESSSPPTNTDLTITSAEPANLISSSDNANTNTNNTKSGNAMTIQSSWKMTVSKFLGNWVGVDSIFSVIRFARKVMLWSTAAAVVSIRTASTLSSLVPSDWESWAKARENASLQAARLDWTQEAVDALLDVHGYQILNQGLFNADPHPGNILIVQDEKNGATTARPKLGLIDYGQCKRLTPEERVKIAKLILSVANEDSDESVASHFRNLGIQTKNDSTLFLAQFARLMFGSFRPEHMDHAWHRNLHEEDRVVYFPKELSMVYRTSLLLRGLAMSLQLNVSIGQQWRHHAEAAIKNQ